MAETVFCSCAVSTALGQDLNLFLDHISESPKSWTVPLCCRHCSFNGRVLSVTSICGTQNFVLWVPLYLNIFFLLSKAEMLIKSSRVCQGASQVFPGCLCFAYSYNSDYAKKLKFYACVALWYVCFAESPLPTHRNWIIVVHSTKLRLSNFKQ